MFPFAHRPNPVRKKPRHRGIRLHHLNEEGSVYGKAGKGCPAKDPFLEARTTCQWVPRLFTVNKMTERIVRSPEYHKTKMIDKSVSLLNAIDQLLDLSLGRMS